MGEGEGKGGRGGEVVIPSSRIHCPGQCKFPSRPRPDRRPDPVQTPSRHPYFCPDHSEALLEMVKTRYKTTIPTITASDQVVPFIKLKGSLSCSWPAAAARQRSPPPPGLHGSSAHPGLTRVVGQEF